MRGPPRASDEILVTNLGISSSAASTAAGVVTVMCPRWLTLSSVPEARWWWDGACSAGNVMYIPIQG